MLRTRCKQIYIFEGYYINILLLLEICLVFKIQSKIKLDYGSIQNCLNYSNNHEEHVAAMNTIWNKGNDTKKKIFAFFFLYYLFSVEVQLTDSIILVSGLQVIQYLYRLYCI